MEVACRKHGTDEKALNFGQKTQGRDTGKPRRKWKGRIEMDVNKDRAS